MTSKADYKVVLERLRKSMIENCQDADAQWIARSLDDIDDALDDVTTEEDKEDIAAKIRAGLKGEKFTGNG